MIQHHPNLQQKFKLIIKLLVGLGFGIFLFCDRPFGTFALSQIVPDNTLGDENSQVIPDQTIKDIDADLIEGGAQRGQNLFHSFSQFNVESGRSAYFANPEGIANIFSRVTGSDVSDILGTLGVSGNADLFFINPNGIIFGENASLDVNGSFLATTADAIQFAEQGEFNAVDPDAPPLLTVQPSALFVNQMQPGTIESRSIAPEGTSATGNTDLFGLRVDDANLALIGGDIIIDGEGVDDTGNSIKGGLTALDGRIELGGLAKPGRITLNEDGSASFPANVARANVSLKNSNLDVSQNGLGAVSLTASEIEISNSRVTAQVSPNFGGSDIQPGDIVLDASENISIVDNSRIDNSSFGVGNAGRIDIQAGESIVISSSNVFNVVFTEIGDAGGIEIETARLEIEDESEVSSSTFGAGNAGQINIQAESIIVDDATSILNQTFDEGNAGNTFVEAKSLTLRDGGNISSSSFGEGDAGSIEVNAQSIVASGTAPLRLVGTDQDIPGGFSSGFLATTELGSSEIEGNIEVNTDSLQISQGAVISTRTNNSALGGNITVNTDTLTVDSGGQILTSATSSGNAGVIELNITENLAISGSDFTFSDRQEGVIDLAEQAGVNPEELIDPVSSFSGVFANTTEGSSGNGGNINIKGLNDNSALQNLTIAQEGQITLDNQGTGNGGDLFLQTEILTLADSASISADTQSGQGGNIKIDTEFLIGSDNSDIVANASDGMGGFIQITATGIFGLETSDQLTDSSDITAFSQQDPQLDGTVEIETLEVEQNLRLNQLPTKPISTQVAQTCKKESSKQQSEFVISGRGSLPDSPQGNLNSDFGLEDWRVIDSQNNSPVSDQKLPTPEPNSAQEIVEASNWILSDRGKIILIVDNSKGTSSSLIPKSPASCSIN